MNGISSLRLIDCLHSILLLNELNLSEKILYLEHILSMKNEKGKLISQSLITRVPNYRVNPILILLWIKFCTMNDSRNYIRALSKLLS